MAAGKGSKGSRGKKRPPAKAQAGRRPAAGPPSSSNPGSTAPVSGGASAGGGAGAGAGATAGPPKPPGSVSAPPVKAKPTRVERLEAARRARQRKARLVRVGVAGAVALLVLVVALVVIDNRKDADANKQRLTAGSCTFDSKSDRTDPPPNNHVPPASYAVNPPAGGDHDPAAAGAGFYSDEGQTPPSDQQIVHAMEHGYVVIWHKPGLAEKDIAAMRTVFDRYPDDVLVVPRASLPVETAATAWGRRLLCTDLEPTRLSDFVRLYRNKGPERVPHT